jgi:Flp pilus assembly protein TadD
MTRRVDGSGRCALAIVLIAVLAACTAPAPRQGAQITRAATFAAPAQPGIPADADRRFKAALALMRQQQPQEAAQALRALADDFPELSGVLTNLGILHAQARDREAALASFSRAIEANPDNAVALNWLGVLYRENGDYLRAERAYRRAIAVRPDYLAAQLNLGILYDVYLRRPQDAVAAYRSYRAGGGEDLIVEAWIRDLESRHGIQTAQRAQAQP